MVNQDLVNKYQRALEMCNSRDDLGGFISQVRETLYKVLQPDYIATIDEVVWVECFINREQYEEREDNEMMMLKPFEKMDWNAWAGATCFADGTQPMIAVKHFDDWEVNVIVDFETVQIHLVGDHEALFVDIQNVTGLCKRFKIAIGNDICVLIDTCLSKDGMMKKLEDEMGLVFEQYDTF